MAPVAIQHDGNSNQTLAFSHSSHMYHTEEDSKLSPSFSPRCVEPHSLPTSVWQQRINQQPHKQQNNKQALGCIPRPRPVEPPRVPLEMFCGCCCCCRTRTPQEMQGEQVSSLAIHSLALSLPLSPHAATPAPCPQEIPHFS